MSEKIQIRIRRQSGYSLIELLLVVTIVAALAAIALPSYRDNVLRSNRSVAQAGLMELVNRQTNFHLNNKTYTADLNNLGYPAGRVFGLNGKSVIVLDDQLSPVDSSDTSRIYLIQIDSAATNTLTASAIPQQFQANDIECGTFSIDQTGAQTISGTGTIADCW